MLHSITNSQLSCTPMSKSDSAHPTAIDKSSYFMATGETDTERLRIVNDIYNPVSFGFLIRNGLKALLKNKWVI